MKFTFRVDPPGLLVSDSEETTIVLQRSTWDDFGYGTSFALSVVQGQTKQRVGTTKIAKVGMTSEGSYAPTQFTQLPEYFYELGSEYFSVGTDADLYRNLVSEFGATDAKEALKCIRDLASMPELLDTAIREHVVQSSLFRSISVRTVQDQYQTILSGELEKSSFSLKYTLRPNEVASPTIEFTVEPNWTLPSNVHVLIGANGTGKTTALRNIRWALDDSNSDLHRPEHLTVSDESRIASLVSVSFSPFEVFPDQHRSELNQAKFRVTNVGLSGIMDPNGFKNTDNDPEISEAQRQQKHYQLIISSCAIDRSERLLRAMRFLSQADIILEQHGIDNENGLMNLDFSTLSSGHKIVLLTMASLVLYCEEKTLVLIDEPESFLHPPLLGAFTRALSWLMTETNGLAIVATHSAVVLQEVPRRCAWKIWSVGSESEANQVEIETFGENLGLLTREIFGLELDKSGYHELLRELASRHIQYSDAIEELGGEVGEEAKLLLRSLLRRNSGTVG